MAFGTVTESTTLSTSTETTSDFNAMLKRYMPYKLLRTEVEKRSYFLQKVSKKSNWKGGVMEVPFKAALASSFRYGKLITAANITQSKYVKGFVQGYKEIWGAMKFYDQDLTRHGDIKQSYLESLMRELPDFAEAMKERVSQAFLNGPAICTVTDVTDADTGILVVDRPELLEIGQYVEIGASAATYTGWVSLIDIDSGAVTIVTSMSDVDNATNALDMSTSAAVDDSLRLEDGFDTTVQFTSLPDQLLSLANGGSTTLFGVAKTKYPFLQAVNYSGAAIATGDILSTIFGAYSKTKRIGKSANCNEVLMSYTNLQNAMVELEASGSGIGTGRQFTAGDRKVNAYGWTTIEVSGVKGSVTLVGINEMRDDIMYGLDWRGIELHSNGMFERRRSPSGNEYYEERTEDGFVYIVDIRFFGELVVSLPSYQFIIHSIDY